MLFQYFFQSLLSENTVDDQHWPKELILLREKFTAKSQLEITQLNIKHADEVGFATLSFINLIALLIRKCMADVADKTGI